jgi:hypothetical protein
MIPLGLKQNVPSAHSSNPTISGYSHDTVLLITKSNWYCTGLLFCIRCSEFILISVQSVSFPVLLFIQLFDLFCFCLICCICLFSVQLFIYSVLFSVLILELYSRYLDPYKIIKQPSGKSINIIHQTAPSFVLV